MGLYDYYQAYQQDNAMKQQQQMAMDAMKFPALSMSQPGRMLAAQGGYNLDPTSNAQLSAQLVPHRRHYHRHKLSAVLEACALYGVKVADITNNIDSYMAKYPMKDVAFDPMMEKQRWHSGIQSAFDANASIDPTNPNPEPGVINRAPG